MAFTEHIKVALGLESANFKKGLSGAESKTKSFAKNVKGYLVGALAVGALVRTTKTIVDFGATIGDVSDRLGVSAEFLQEFQYSATQSGSSAEEASKAIEKLSKSVGEAEIGTKLYKDAFERLGVSLRDADGNLKSTEQVTREVANGLQALDDPAIKVKTAFDLMGRAGTAMIQTMQNGEQGLDDFAKQARTMGLVVGNDSVKALQDASGKIEILERSWKVLLAEVAPSVTSFFRGLVAVLKLIKVSLSSFTQGVEVFGKTMKKVISTNVEKQINRIQIKLAELKVAFAKFSPFADQKDVKRFEDNLKKLKSRQIELNKSAISFKDAKKQVFQEDQRLLDTQKKFNRTVNEVKGTFSDIFSEKIQNQTKVNSLTEEEKEAVAQITDERTQEEVAITRTLQKQLALYRGGLESLKVVEERHKLEDQIQKLLKDGNLTRDEARKKALSILDAEQQELALQEQIKKQKEKQVALKEKKEKREELLADLQKEIETRTEQIKVQKQLFELDQQIDQARANGNVALEEQLEAQRIKVELGQLEFDQAIERGQQLEKELELKQNIRRDAQLELDAIKARAEGNDDLADAIEFQMKLRKEIADIADRQEIKEAEALGQVQQRLDLEAKIAGQRIQANKQELIDNNVLRFAKMNLRDAEDRDERKKILNAQSIERLNKRIAELREKGGAFTDKEIKKLEGLREQKLGILLDDKTKEELKKLEVQELDMKAEQKIRVQELQKAAQKIRDEEAKRRQREQEQLQKLEAKKLELLDQEKEIAKTLLDEVKNAELEAQADWTDSAKATLNDFINNFKTAINSFEVPSLSSYFPTSSENGMKIDTEGLASDQVLREISRKLDGKYRNE